MALTLKNFTGRATKTLEEEFSAIEDAQGTLDNYGKPFELIRVKLNSLSNIPVMVSNFQDTIVMRHPGGTTEVKHAAPGMGSLKFFPNRFNELFGYIARTEYNMTMLSRVIDEKVSDGRPKYIVQNPSVAKEVQEMHDKWYNGLNRKEKEDHDTFRRFQNMSPHQVEPNFGMRGTTKVIPEDSDTQKKLQELQLKNAELEAKLRKAEFDEAKEHLEGMNEKIEAEAKTDPSSVAKPEDFDNIKYFALIKLMKSKGLESDPAKVGGKDAAIKSLIESRITRLEIEGVLKGE